MSDAYGLMFHSIVAALGCIFTSSVWGEMNAYKKAVAGKKDGDTRMFGAFKAIVLFLECAYNVVRMAFTEL